MGVAVGGIGFLFGIVDDFIGGDVLFVIFVVGIVYEYCVVGFLIVFNYIGGGFLFVFFENGIVV